MFFNLLLAHFLADYPLTPDWVAQNKTRLGVLLLHGATHFVTLVVVTFPASMRTWPSLLLLAAIHISIDASKNWTNQRLLRLAVPVYLIDQAIHWGAIGLVAAWTGRNTPGLQPFLSQRVAIYALGFLLVTYVWLITERVIARAGSQASPALTGKLRWGDADRVRPSQGRVNEPGPPQAWSRLAVRAILLAVILLGWKMLPAMLATGAALQFPYPANRRGFYAFCVDVSVSVCIGVLVILAQGLVH